MGLYVCGDCDEIFDEGGWCACSRKDLVKNWIVCPSCDELVPRNEADEHVCPIEDRED